MPGTVNVVDTMSCTSPIVEILLGVALYANGSLVSSAPTVTTTGTASAQNNTAITCSSNPTTTVFYGYGESIVQFPPLYNPEYGQAEDQGSATILSC